MCNSKILIMGIVLEFALLVLSLLIILTSYHCIISSLGLKISFIFTIYYNSTYLSFFSDSEILVFVESSVKKKFSQFFFVCAYKYRYGTFLLKISYFIFLNIVIALYTIKI